MSEKKCTFASQNAKEGKVMSTMTLNSLLNYLLATLSINNRQWLAEHLLNADAISEKQKTQAKEAAYLTSSMQRAWKEVQSGKQMSSIDSFIAELQ